MDQRDFDAFARAYAAGLTRRGMLRTGLALVGAALGFRSGTVAAARRRSVGQLCREHSNCDSGLCGSPDRSRRRRCLCQTLADCPATDQCYDVACVDGICGTTVLGGQACDDGDLCTIQDTCSATGECVGTPVVCTALDQCHDAGTCDPASGVCSNPAKADGTPCNDGNANTSGETCQAGVCICTPESSATTCDSATCGFVENNCGQVISCGTCGSGQRCVNGTCVDSSVCLADGASCSTGTDCCSTLCENDGVNFVCVCHAPGFFCSSGVTCCSGACGGGFCCEVTVDASCNGPTNCCSPLSCVNGTCQN